MTFSQQILRLVTTWFFLSMIVILIGVIRITPQESVSNIGSKSKNNTDTGILEDSGTDPCLEFLGEEAETGDITPYEVVPEGRLICD